MGSSHRAGRWEVSTLIDDSNGPCATPCDYGGRSTMSYGRGAYLVESPSCFHHGLFRNTVKRESCRKLTDCNSASRYNRYSASRSDDRDSSSRSLLRTCARSARSSSKSFLRVLPCPWMRSSWLVIDNRSFILWIKNSLDRPLIGSAVSIFRQPRIFNIVETRP